MNRDIARALTAALSLGRQGYAVFPCGPNKRPVIPKADGGEGYKDAVTDPAAIEEMWRRHPGVLVGVATGAMSGISVLDIDLVKHPEAAAWWEYHWDRLEPARMHRTRSGGLHLVYKHRPGVNCSEGKINRGVDTRGDGGYAIWWPAVGLQVISDPGIAPWPEWLMPLLEPPPPVSISRRALAGRPGDLRPLLNRAAGILRAVVEATEGERNRILFWASCRATEMVVAGELDHPTAMQVFDLLREAADRTGLPRREAERTIASAMRRAA
jgi:hypothetical protein